MSFEAYGLNKYRNFLCGKTITLDENKELFDFMCAVISDHSCPESAVFAIDYYDGMWAGIAKVNLNGDVSDDEIELFGRKDFDVEWFAQLDADYRFCCYALIIETAPGVWKIVEEKLKEDWYE